MPPSPSRRQPRSLADAAPGDLVRVRLIVFELVRSRCWDLDVRQGEILQCVDESDGRVDVARADGSRITVPRECARFIGVESVREHLDPDDGAEDELTGPPGILPGMERAAGPGGASGAAPGPGSAAPTADRGRVRARSRFSARTPGRRGPGR